MNWLDVVLLIVLAYSTIRSFTKGFSREIIGLAASVFAIILGMWFYGSAAGFLLPYVSSVRVANLLGFLLVFAAVLMLGSLIGAIVRRFLRTVGLSLFDRLLGACFGLLRGVLILSALLTAFIAFGPHADTNTAPASVLNSRIAPYVLQASRLFVALAPMELKQRFAKYYPNGNERQPRQPD